MTSDARQNGVMARQTLQVRVTSDTLNNQSSDWPRSVDTLIGSKVVYLRKR